MEMIGSMNGTRFLKTILIRRTYNVSPPWRILGPAPKTTGGRLLPVVAIIDFLTVLLSEPHERRHHQFRIHRHDRHNRQSQD